MLATEAPFPQYFDTDGSPLDGGRVWFGVANQNPETSPITVYWDAAGTQPAAQPLVTHNGYTMRSGTPAVVYASSDYSLTVRNKYGAMVYTAASSQDFSVAMQASAQATQLAADLANTVTAEKGAGRVGFNHALHYAAGTVGSYLKMSAVSVKAFGAVGDGSTDDTVSIQACLDANPRRAIFFPAGTYLVTSALAVSDYQTLVGDGWTSVIKATTDIEIIRSANLDTEFLVGVALRDLQILSTRVSPTTKYQVHLRNALLTRIERCHIKSGLPDTPPNGTDVGGVKLDKTITGAPAGAGSYINWIEGNFIQNGGLLIDSGAGGGVTDSVIRGNFIYGHSCAHALKLVSPTGNFIIEANNFSSPQGSAAIWINGGAVDHIRIVGNFFDGNPSVLDAGHGILSDAGAPRVTVVGNAFWAMGKSAIRAVDPVMWTVTGNTFLDNNDADNYWPDVEIVGIGFQPNHNVIANNVFQQQAPRTKAGYAILETNGGSAPVENLFMGNRLIGDAAGYASGGIATASVGVQQSDMLMNGGFASAKGNSGNWTPVIAGSSTAGAHTYSAQSGVWRRLPGKLVFVQATVTLTAKDAAMAGNVEIQGLPIPAAASGAVGSFSVGNAIGISHAYSQLALIGITNTTRLRLMTFQSAATGADVVSSNIAATSSITFSGFYAID